MSLFDIFSFALVLSVLVGFALASFALSRRDVPGATAFGIVVVGKLIWGGFYLIELHATSLEAKLIWDNLQFAGVSLIGASTLVFALTYTGRELLARRLLPVLWAEPLMTTLLVWTDGAHGLVRQNPRLETLIDEHQLLLYDYGPWFLFASVYNIMLTFGAVVILVSFALGVSPRHRRPVWMVAIGISIPLAGAVLTVLGLVPIGARHLDISPLTFAFASSIIAWSLFRNGLLDLVPFARAQLIDQMTDAVLVVDAAGLVVDANPPARAVFERPDQPLIGGPALSLPASLGGILGGSPDSDISLELRLDGEQGALFLAGAISVLRTKRGRITGWLTVLRDVTTAHQAAERLAASEARHRALVGAMPDMLLTISNEGQILDYRPPRQDPPPLMREQLVGRQIEQVLPPDVAVLTREAIGRVTLIGDVVVYEYAVELGLTRRTLEARMVRVDADELLSIVRDITTRRQADVELHQAKVAAEAADCAKSAFLATISHELRTPLTTVIAMADRLLAADIPAAEGEYARTIRAAGQTMLGIMNNVLDLSQMDGSLTATSTPGAESPFTRCVPLRSEPEQPRQLEVLIVEDDPRNQAVARRMVEYFGHTVECAINGFDALDRIGRSQFDVILMDIQMPLLDGIETTRRIRALGGAVRQPRIIAFTASAMSGDRERYLAAGMDDVLAKPVQLANLEAVLTR